MWRAVLVAILAGATAVSGALPVFMGAGYRQTPSPQGCPDGWPYISAESWWRRELEPPGGFTAAALDFGHQHTETCWPQMMEMAGKD